MLIGPAGGRLASAARIATDNGTAVRHVDGIETAMALLHSGGADLLMADVSIDIRRLAERLSAAGIQAPMVACGTHDVNAIASDAIRAGAKEYIPLPENPDVIAAILAAVAGDGSYRRAVETGTRALVGRTLADVERDLILETLKRCLGNRTHAAGILGISIRTLRNKLAVYAATGAAVPPPNNGEILGAA